MASVTSLDQDMRRLRMERYTPAAANEVKSWMEDVLREKLAASELLDGLRDGVALCKSVLSNTKSRKVTDQKCRLANLALPPTGIRYKSSSMPFQQMENISQFLRACEMPPFNLPSHDRFLTVDLYDGKDPAQVVQCIGAFSRAANSIRPDRFPRVIGPKRAGSPIKKTVPTEPFSGGSGAISRARAVSNTSQGSEQTFGSKSPTPGGARVMSPSLTGGSNSSKTTTTTTTTTTNGSVRQPRSNVSSWSKRSDEGQTSPAWNIAQYGYMGGASQGNQGVVFGAPRQITSSGISVPSLAEKERRRKEREAEEEAARAQQQEETRRKEAAREAEEGQARLEEERRWEEETNRAREKERQELERQKRQWEEEERRWKEEEERRAHEERAELDPARKNSNLKGQHLSQYQLMQGQPARSSPRSRIASGQQLSHQTTESDRIRELERELEEAKERERQYQLEREEKRRQEDVPNGSAAPQSFRRNKSVPESDVDDSFTSEDKSYVGVQSANEEERTSPRPQPSARPLPNPQLVGFTRPTKPLDPPQAEPQPQPPPRASADPPQPSTDTSRYSSSRPQPQNRTDRFLASNPAPELPKPASHHPAEMGMTSGLEQAAEDARRVAGQNRTKAGGWASKSLLEREMERERERQREWEEEQMQKAKAGGSAAGARGIIGPRAMGGR